MKVSSQNKSHKCQRRHKTTTKWGKKERNCSNDEVTQQRLRKKPSYVQERCIGIFSFRHYDYLSIVFLCLKTLILLHMDRLWFRNNDMTSGTISLILSKLNRLEEGLVNPQNSIRLTEKTRWKNKKEQTHCSDNTTKQLKRDGGSNRK